MRVIVKFASIILLEAFFILSFGLSNSSIFAAESKFTVKPPPGFEDLSEEERTIIDIYYQGKKIATTVANYQLDTIQFEDPEGLSKLIPDVRDYTSVIDALRKPIAQNRHLHCSIESDSSKSNCNYLDPEIIGVIFYPDKLAAHVFINQRYTYSRDSRARYLPPPNKGLGLIIGTDSRGVKNHDTDNLSGNTRVKMISGYGRTSLNADLYVNWDNQQQLQSAHLSYIGQTTELQAGYLPYSANSQLVRNSRILGLRYASTLDTRIDKESLNTSEIPIQASAGALVRIIREGIELDVQRVESGASFLDTRRLPQGAYDLTLMIEENGSVREEQVFFSKSSRLPPIGHPQWSMEIGYPTNSSINSQFLPEANDSLQINLGYQRRLLPRIGFRGNLSLNENYLYSEFATVYQGQNINGELGLLVARDGDLGYQARIGVQYGKLNINANYRNLDAQTQFEPSGLLEYEPFPFSFRQGSLNASYRFDKARLGLRAYYRQSKNENPSYYGGLYFDWDIVKQRKHRLSLFGQYELGKTRESYYAGLRFSTLYGSLSFNGQYNTRINKLNNNNDVDQREMANVEMRYRNDSDALINNHYVIGARYDRNNGRDELGYKVGVVSNTPFARIELDERQNYQGQNNTLASLSSTFAVSPSGFAFSPNFQDSGVILELEGAHDTQFDLIGNGNKKKSIGNNGHVFIPLNSYEIHDISIKPVKSKDVEYEHYADRIVTYPGNIVNLNRKVNSVYIVVGRAIDASGKPLNEVGLYTDRFLGHTDESGYFQLDLNVTSQLEVKLQGEYLCKIDIQISESDVLEDFVDLGEVICQSS